MCKEREQGEEEVEDDRKNGDVVCSAEERRGVRGRREEEKEDCTRRLLGRERYEWRRQGSVGKLSQPIKMTKI